MHLGKSAELFKSRYNASAGFNNKENKMTTNMEKSLKNPSPTRAVISVKSDYKKMLIRAAAELSLECNKIIPAQEVLYKVLRNYLNNAVDDIRQDFN